MRGRRGPARPLRGRDPARRCELDELDHATAREAMLAALRFRAFPDALPLLATLRARGVRVVAASNWDASLPDALERTGLAPYLDGAVSSAVVGAAKPDPAVFRAALELAGCEPAEAFHVGDSPQADVEGARAAGIRVALLDRHGVLPDPPQGVPEDLLAGRGPVRNLACLTAYQETYPVPHGGRPPDPPELPERRRPGAALAALVRAGRVPRGIRDHAVRLGDRRDHRGRRRGGRRGRHTAGARARPDAPPGR